MAPPPAVNVQGATPLRPNTLEQQQAGAHRSYLPVPQSPSASAAPHSTDPTLPAFSPLDLSSLAHHSGGAAGLDPFNGTWGLTFTLPEGITSESDEATVDSQWTWYQTQWIRDDTGDSIWGAMLTSPTDYELVDGFGYVPRGFMVNSDGNCVPINYQ